MIFPYIPVTNIGSHWQKGGGWAYKVWESSISYPSVEFTESCDNCIGTKETLNNVMQEQEEAELVQLLLSYC